MTLVYRNRLLLACIACTMLRNSSHDVNAELLLVPLTKIIINRTVVLRCTGDERNESWYLKKGDDLLIDDGSINSKYSHDRIHTNHTRHSMYIEFNIFSHDYLDVYRCVREKRAPSNILDLNDIFKSEPQQAEVICKNITAARGARFINLLCTIKHHGIVCGDNIFWENGKTGEKIYTMDGLYEVACKDSVNDSFITTSLNINKVTDEVIRTNYFMVYVNRYHTAERYLVTVNQDLPKKNKLVLSISLGSSAGLVLVLVAIIVTCLLITRNERSRDCSGTHDEKDFEKIELKKNSINEISTKKNDRLLMENG